MPNPAAKRRRAEIGPRETDGRRQVKPVRRHRRPGHEFLDAHSALHGRARENPSHGHGLEAHNLALRDQIQASVA